MATPKDIPRDIGGFIRDLRRNAQISLRQLAEQAGVSNPYLSQIERGLRKPSAEVLQQLASALRVSTPVMYLRAGLLEDKEGPGVLDAIVADPDLTMAQKQSLSQIYETFRRENLRESQAQPAPAEPAPAEPAPAEPRSATPPPATPPPAKGDGQPVAGVVNDPLAPVPATASDEKDREAVDPAASPANGTASAVEEDQS
jgi:transcriptional regulator with XRE-family HTH domain